MVSALESESAPAFGASGRRLNILRAMAAEVGGQLSEVSKYEI
jgi:hypothetical protein